MTRKISVSCPVLLFKENADSTCLFFQEKNIHTDPSLLGKNNYSLRKLSQKLVALTPVRILLPFVGVFPNHRRQITNVSRTITLKI